MQTPYSQKQVIALDVDNTLTPPRYPLQSDMACALRRLRVPFVLSAGGDLDLISDQFTQPLHRSGYRGSFAAFLCNGARRYQFDLTETISDELIRDFSVAEFLGDTRFRRLLQLVENTLNLEEFQFPRPITVIGERIVNRKSMINVAPIGRPRGQLTDQMHENRVLFQKYDLQSGFRQRFLARLSLELADFLKAGMHISLGGQTSFDLVVKGNDKSFALKTLLEEGASHVWFVGDALFNGGNDEAVLKFIESWDGPQPCPVEAIKVESWRDTIDIFRRLSILDDESTLCV